MEKKIRKWCRAFGLTVEDANEIAQDHKLQRLTKITKQSAKQFVIDSLRKRGFDVSRGGPSIHQTFDELPIQSVTPEIEKQIDLLRALDDYPPLSRAILILRRQYGYSAKEIAFIFGVKESWVVWTLNNPFGE